MFRAVPDTNVLVSGGTLSTGIPSQIIDHWRSRNFVMVMSPQLIAEYAEVLLRPKIRKYTGLSELESIQYVEEVANRAYVTRGTLALDVLREDPDDNLVLACAVEGSATHLVTGNKKHFPFSEYQNIQIISPREFLDLLS